MSFQEAEVQIGHKKQIAYSATDSSYLKVDGTIEINLPEAELGESEITNDDTADFGKDYQPALYEPGTVTVSYVYTKTQFALIEAKFQQARVAATRAAATMFWQTTLPDGSTAKFKGYIKSHKLPMDQEGTLVSEFEIRVRTKITYAPPTP